MSDEREPSPTELFLEQFRARQLPEPPQPALSNTRLHELEQEHGAYTLRSRQR